MLALQATEVRKQWSAVCDSVVHDRPKFIKRTRDKMWLSNLDTMAEILSMYKFTTEKFIEEDGSVTLSLNEMDLVENGATEEEARMKLGLSILEYSTDFYEQYDLYSHAPNRKGHIPYIFKALIEDDPKKIGEDIVCQDGRN